MSRSRSATFDFGIRVDEVWTLIDLIATGAEPAGSRAYPHSTYRALPGGRERTMIVL